MKNQTVIISHRQSKDALIERRFTIDNVIKVGDTISDIKEGKNAGVYTVGVIEGSSEMGLTEAEYNTLTDADKKEKTESVSTRFMDAGADAVILNIKELLSLIK